jgi:hypothetical protein
VPIQRALLSWATLELRAGPLHVRFWTTIVLTCVIYLPLILVVWMWVTGRRRRSQDAD